MNTLSENKSSTTTSDFKSEAIIPRFAWSPNLNKIYYHDRFHIKLGRESNLSYNVCVISSYVDEKYKLTSKLSYENKLEFVLCFLDMLINFKRRGIRHGSLSRSNIYYDPHLKRITVIDL